MRWKFSTVLLSHFQQDVTTANCLAYEKACEKNDRSVYKSFLLFFSLNYTWCLVGTSAKT